VSTNDNYLSTQKWFIKIIKTPYNCSLRIIFSNYGFIHLLCFVCLFSLLNTRVLKVYFYIVILFARLA
jgi:hypothetical protein